MIIQKITPSDALDLQFTTDVPEVEERKSPVHYVDNKELHAEFVKYHELKVKAIADGKPRPRLSEKIGAAILQIANRRVNSHQFVNYSPSWKEEMVGEAIETCVLYVHNFDPTRYSNPFAYITQLVTNAIIQRIKQEHKHLYIRYKSFDNAGGFQAYHDHIDGSDEDTAGAMNEMSDMYNGHLQFIDHYEKTKLNPKKDEVDQQPQGVLAFLVDSDEE